MKTSSRLTLWIVLLIITIILISQTAFDNGSPTCRNYIKNTYLYLTCALLLLFIFLDWFYLQNYYGENSWLWIGFIGMIVSLLAIISTESIFVSHLFFIIFAISAGLMMYSTYLYLQKRDDQLLQRTLIATLSVFIFLSTIAYFKPEWLSLKYYPYLMGALLILILIQLFFFYGMSKQMRVWLYYAGVFLFGLFILYDTKILRINAQHCSTPNYPRESLHLFLDLVNMFNYMLGMK